MAQSGGFLWRIHGARPPRGSSRRGRPRSSRCRRRRRRPARRAASARSRAARRARRGRSSTSASGTPITGRSVCAATTPGSAAARPAPQIRTRRPALACGLRVLGDRVRVAVGGAHLELVLDPALGRARPSPPASARGRTRSRRGSRRVGSDTRRLRPGDVGAVVRARERDRRRAFVRDRAGLLELVGNAGHAQDPAAVRHQLLALPRGTRVEDERAGRLGRLDPFDRRACVVPRGVFAGRRRSRSPPRAARRRSACRRGRRLRPRRARRGDRPRGAAAATASRGRRTGS